MTYIQSIVAKCNQFICWMYDRYLEYLLSRKLRQHLVLSLTPIFYIILVFPAAIRKVAVATSDVIGRAKQAPHWGVQSRFHVIYN